mmetsp:Transcript_31590/g.30896  ORF Transcript_31590/g.30896 Transcript_31590/m.30896 type:complete len:81 (+) Transcript_31590:877-1119(+)
MTYSVYFFEILAIVIFSVISANITGLENSKSLQMYVQDKKQDCEKILYELDQVEGIELQDETYDDSLQVIIHSYIHGVRQ